jgi:hypothetical protein
MPQIDFAKELATIDFEAELAALKPMPSHEPSGVPATPVALTGLAASKVVSAAAPAAHKVAGAVNAVGQLPFIKAVTGPAVPKVAGYLEKAAAPAGTRLSSILDASGKAMEVPTKAGPLMRGAGWLSRITSKAALPLTLASGAYDTFNAIRSSAERLDDPNLDPMERQAILLALSGGNAQ